MFTVQSLRTQPPRFRLFTGLTPEQFDRLLAELQPRYATAEHQRLARPQRKRQVGAGRKFCRPLEDRLLLALVWLRMYPTYELLGALFAVDKGTVCHWLHPLLGLLREVTSTELRWPDPAQRPRNVEAFLRDFPAAGAIIDATEQRLRRPKDPEGTPREERGARQRPYYSGKKKAHTLKTQIAVTLDGQIAEVSTTVPGSVNDLTLLRESKALARVPGVPLLDSGYQGIQKDDPTQRLYRAHRASRGHPLTAAQKAANQVLGRYRVRVEHTLACLKQYQVLAAVYRHAREVYHDVFCVVAVLTNRRRGFQPSVAC